MKFGDVIINNASVNAYIGRPDLLDYTSTKGAIIAFTRGLSNQYVAKGIRCTALAPGPVWTPLVRLRDSLRNATVLTDLGRRDHDQRGA